MLAESLKFRSSEDGLQYMTPMDASGECNARWHTLMYGVHVADAFQDSNGSGGSSFMTYGCKEIGGMNESLHLVCPAPRLWSEWRHCSSPHVNINKHGWRLPHQPVSLPLILAYKNCPLVRSFPFLYYPTKLTKYIHKIHTQYPPTVQYLTLFSKSLPELYNGDHQVSLSKRRRFWKLDSVIDVASYRNSIKQASETFQGAGATASKEGNKSMPSTYPSSHGLRLTYLL